MSKPSSASSGAQSPKITETLTDQVLARVADARIALDRRTSVPEEERLQRSLRRVFRDLGVNYRRYRKQTGQPVWPALRDAAYKFRAAPSLTSLVAVAAFLDELDLLN